MENDIYHERGEKIVQVSREGRVNFGWGPGTTSWIQCHLRKIHARWNRVLFTIIIVLNFPHRRRTILAHPCPLEFRNIYVACFAANGSVCVVCLGSFPIVLGTPPDVQMEAALSATTYQWCPLRPLLFPSGFSRYPQPKRVFPKATHSNFSSSFSLPSLAVHVC